MVLRSIGAAELPATSSVLIAQALSAALATAYGLAFIGLWLQFRRRPMLFLARAWLLFGALAAASPLFSDRLLAIASVAEVEALSVGLALLTAVAYLDATLVFVGREALRPRAWAIGGVVTALAVVGLLAGEPTVGALMRGFGPRLFAVAVLGTAIGLALRAPPFGGRRFLTLGLAFLWLRFAAGLVVELAGGGAISLAGQPTVLTFVQLLTLALAGYGMTAAAFAQEHEETMRERLRLERQAGRAQRLESVERIAGSVAHDFNNVLAVALGACEALGDRAASEAESRAAVEDLRAAVARGRALTQQLLEFSRPDRGTEEAFDPQARLAQLVPMVRRLVGERVSVDVVAAAGAATGPVRANPAQFDQVMLNLAANARDAMPDGGSLRISCSPATGASAGGAAALRIAVTDSGPGMAPEVAERVFDPFFTTKPQGQGTGLGLATAFAFAKHAGGDLTVETAPGAGATFTLTLPVARAAVPPG